MERREEFMRLASSVVTIVGLFGLAASLSAQPARDRVVRTVDAGPGGEVRIVVTAGCARCDWGAAGREGVALRISVDGTYSQHLMLARGATAEYEISLGSLAAGSHQVVFDRDGDLSAKSAGAASIELARTSVLTSTMGEAFTAAAMAPILYARPNTVGRFTDLPLFMWYETAATPRGREFRYSVIFSNEDGGTPTDRLMATWGRTTDIEFVYGVEIDQAGRVLSETFQGPGHEVPAFTGKHEGRHPLLWVSTDNNMVSESGPTAIRYALAAEKADLTDRSRETVMDAHPWLYAVMAQELSREGKIAADAPPGRGIIPDPRRFVYVDACATVGPAALALAIGVRKPGASPNALEWIPSDRGVVQYRVVRDGCARIATPLASGVDARDVKAIRVLAFTRPPSNGAPGGAAAQTIELTRINTLFTLDDAYKPTASRLTWVGSQTVRIGGAPFEIAVP